MRNPISILTSVITTGGWFAFLLLGSILAIIELGLVTLCVLAYLSDSANPQYLAFGLLALAVALPTRLIQYLQAVLRQALDEGKARNILEDREYAKRERFFLYLRPFSTQNRIKLKGGGAVGSIVRLLFMPWVFNAWRVVARRDEDEIERLLRRGAREFGLTVALGRRGELIGGAARIATSDQDWQRKADILMDCSDVIFCLPGPSDGTLWELEKLMTEESLRKKTVFINLGRLSEKYGAQYWKPAQEYLRDRGIPFPDFGRRPTFLRIKTLDAEGMDVERIDFRRDFHSFRHAVVLASHEIRTLSRLWAWISTTALALLVATLAAFAFLIR
jgi:hypothetical protein